MTKKIFSTVIGGKTLFAEFNDLALQAHGSVMVTLGQTVVLATAVMAKTANIENDFLPLSVEYEQKFYATGRILGNKYSRREGHPTDEAVLAGRIVDRTIRPLFDQWIRNEIQVIISVLAEGEDSPEPLAVLAASLALGTSEIPWHGPVSAATIRYPSTASHPFELIACGKDGMINMIELAGREVAESAVVEALKTACGTIDKLQEFQQKIIKEIGSTKIVLERPAVTTAVEMAPPIELITNGKRLDGRAVDEIRPLGASVGGISPVLHGSAVFYRGQTHILSVVTLGGPGDSQLIDGREHEEYKRFIHHYNFPPFSTGETGRAGGVNRRMIGHGALGEKALFPVIPPIELFPYTIRVVSEALSSNGSTSMASICASSLALMDAGVPILRPVAGIAIGCVSNNGTYTLLTDIQGEEDHNGEMDFKVAGTTEGITAIQLDVKVTGIPLEVLTQALDKARIARQHILAVMTDTLAKPRQTVSEHAPHISSMTIPVDKIGLIIGPAGKTIKKIQDTSGVQSINIEDNGILYITGTKDSVAKAREILAQWTTNQ